MPLWSKSVSDGSSQKMGGQILISYRREDSAASARRLYDRLSCHFASNQIFIDVDNLTSGIDFVKAIEERVGTCDVLILVVGKRWLTATDEDGKRRLDNPEDFVRLEIATALKRGIRVIPVLADGASMPRSCDLPDDLKSLVCRNAVEVSHDRFSADAERLIAAVEQALENTRAERRELEERERLEIERRETEKKERLVDDCPSARELAGQLAAAVVFKRPASPGSESAKRISPEPVSQGLPDTVQRAPPESPAYVPP
jgi:hypothetical protein